MYEAKQEILADFVGEKLFRDVNALAELAQKKRPLFRRIWEWFKNLFAGNRGTATEQELRKMERLFEQAVGQRKAVGGEKSERGYCGYRSPATTGREHHAEHRRQRCA